MKFLISKNLANHGPYEIEEVNQFVKDGVFVPSDLAWSEGWEEWKPISNVAGYRPPPHSFANPPPLPYPPPSATSYSFSSPPPITRVSTAPAAAPATQPFLWESLPPGTKKLIVWGYGCGGASLLFFPPFLGVAGLVLGILTLTKGITGHGVAIVAVSTICAFLGIVMGAAGAM